MQVYALRLTVNLCTLLLFSKFFNQSFVSAQITLKLTVPNYFVVLIEDSEVQNRSVGHNVAVFIIHTIQIAKVILTANRIQAFRVYICLDTIRENFLLYVC